MFFALREEGSVHVGLVAQFPDHFHHALVALARDFAPVMQYAVHRPLGEAGATGDVVDGDLFVLCHSGFRLQICE